MCLEGMPSLVPGVLSLLVVAVRDIMSAISQQDDHVKVLVSLLVEKSREILTDLTLSDIFVLISTLPKVKSMILIIFFL